MRMLFKRECGQIIIIAALLLPVLLAMTGMAVDLGSYASDRRSLQNVADAVALAAAQELCATSCTDYSQATAAGDEIHADRRHRQRRCRGARRRGQGVVRRR
jgi:Flp pilus assembly protein TadG